MVTTVVSDADGNVYTAGNFRGTFDFDTGGGTDVHASEDHFNAYLTKHDASGNYGWTRTFGGDGTDQVRAIATDASGNVYIAGDFWYTVDFDTDPVLVDERTAAWDDAFLVKYDATGDYKWARTWGGGGSNVAYSVRADSGGYVYVTGDFYGTTDFNPDPIGEDIHVAGWNDAFLVKYDSSGGFQWAKTWGGTNDNKAPTSAVDSIGNVYVSGYFYGTTDFDPDPVTEDPHSDVGGWDAYLSKYSQTGIYQWTKTWGGSDYDYARAADVDSDGNVYVAGSFRGTSDFDPTVTLDEHSSTGSGYDAFMSRYDSSGSYGWTETLGEDGIDEGYVSITVDPNGDVFGAGTFSAPQLSKYDSLGNYQLISLATNATGVSNDSAGNIYATGRFSGTLDFDTGAGVDEHTGVTYVDVFLVKYLNLGSGGGGGSGGESGGGGGTNLDGSKYSYNYYPVTLDINSTISISCDTSVAMDAIVGTGKSDITLSGNNATDNMAMCNVKTNASSGYKMEWNSSAPHEASGALKSTTNASDTISGYTMTASSETWSIDATASEWGAKLGASSEGYGTGDGGGDYSYASAGGWGTNDGYANGKWMNVPTTSFQIMQKSTETDVDGEYQYLVFGAEIGADKLQPTGTYTQEVTVTATTL